MWAAGGDIGRLGAAKRRMLSFAERPSPVEVAACEGTSAEGMVAVCASVVDLRLQFILERKNCQSGSQVGRRRC